MHATTSEINHALVQILHAVQTTEFDPMVGIIHQLSPVDYDKGAVSGLVDFDKSDDLLVSAGHIEFIAKMMKLNRLNGIKLFERSVKSILSGIDSNKKISESTFTHIKSAVAKAKELNTKVKGHLEQFKNKMLAFYRNVAELNTLCKDAKGKFTKILQLPSDKRKGPDTVFRTSLANLIKKIPAFLDNIESLTKISDSLKSAMQERSSTNIFSDFQ